MTKDDILRMAKMCGHWSGETVEMNDVGLERFAKLVAGVEREEILQMSRNKWFKTQADFEAAIEARWNT